MSMRHPIRGLLIGPFVAPVAYWMGVLLFVRRDAMGFEWYRALRELTVICTFGLPVAYAAALVFGAPILYGLERLKWLRGTTLVAAGAVGGVLVAALIALGRQGALFPVIMPLYAGAALGALVAGACWWAGR
jgi:hypothetical protein